MSNPQVENTLKKLFSAHPISDTFAGLCTGPILIGHRGASLEYPENTIPAFARALELGAHLIELDVRLTRDGHVVVIHDPTIDRTMSGTGKVDSFTLKQLRAMTMKLPAGAAKANQPEIRISTLKEVFRAFPQAIIAVEIKDQNWPLCLKVVELIRRFNRVERTMLVLISLKARYARRLRRFEPGLVTGHTLPESVRFTTLTKLHLSHLFKARGASFEVPLKRGKIKVVTKGFVRAAHEKGIRVFVWTVNDPAMIEKLCQMGVDGIFTDDLASTRASVEKLKKLGK